MMTANQPRWSWAIGVAIGCSAFAARAQDSAPPDPFPPAKAEEVGLAPKSLDAFAEFVKGLVDADELIGAELLVIKNDRTVLHRAFGWKDREERVPMELDTLFCVRSMTKPVVGTAVQLAIEAKHLKPEDAVAKHLPSFDTDTHRAITVEHLLRHTSGLGLSSLVSTTDLSSVKSLRDIVDLAATSTTLFPPGERWSYSDDGADVLGALVEKAEGTPLDRWLRERLFEPLGMRDTLTFVAPDEPLRARIASNYVGSRGNWTRYWKPSDPSLFPTFLASQGLYSTPRDYARFLSLWKERGRASGKRMLRASTVDRALKPAVPASYPTGLRGTEIHWGEMWKLWVDASSPERELLAFGHAGSDGTFAYVFPELDLMVLAFSQSRNNHSFVEFENALDEHLLAPLRKTQLAPPIAYGTEELDALAGLYWAPENEMPIALERTKDGLLVEFPGKARLAVKPTPERDRFELALVSGARIEIERDGDGRPTAVLTHSAKAVERHPRFAPAADLPTLDQVLELRARSIDLERVKALGPLRLEGRFEMGARASGTMTVLCDGFERSRSELAGGGLDVTILLDGDSGWTLAGREPVPEDDAGVERLRFDHPLFCVSDWKERFAELRVLARDDRGGSPRLVLRGTTRKGNARYLVLDADTGRLRAERRIEPDMGVGEIGALVTFDDWRAVGGVELPMHVRYVYANKLVGAFDARYERAEPTGELAADTFRPRAR